MPLYEVHNYACIYKISKLESRRCENQMISNFSKSLKKGNHVVCRS